MKPCVWELWLLSLAVFVYLAACCCADVLFESTCSSARCFCSRKTGRRVQAEQYTVQSAAGVLPDESQSVEMDWLETQSVCRNSPRFGCSLRGWPLLALPFFYLSSSFCPPLLQVTDKCTGGTKTQRKSIRPVSWQKLVHIFDCGWFSHCGLCLDPETLWEAQQ